jgi:hypothetical protein
MAHSVAKFATVNPIAGEVDRKIFGFISNRQMNQEPHAVLIPTNAWMAWAYYKVGGDAKAMTDHYCDEANYGKLYQEPGARSTTHVPNILAIPLSTVRLLELHKKGKMPHKCLEIIMSHINDPTVGADKDAWNLVQDWLITATYSVAKKKKNTSVLGIDIEPVTCNNNKVREWIRQCLNKTMGAQQKSPPAMLPPQQVANSITFSPPTHIPPTTTGLAYDIGRAIGLALKTATPAGLMPNATKGTNVVWPYTKDESLIMGFCNLVRARDLPKIWQYFTALKVKQVKIHQRQLQKLMEDWSHNYHTEIDTIFFEQKTLEDIINLWFNPGEGIAQYRMAKRGITILVCRPRGIEETEQLCDHKHATEATKSMHTLQEASNLTTLKPCLLASTFYEVRRNIRTFCVFLYVLFGSKCEYYAKVMDLKKIFDNPSTQSIHEAFTVPMCCRIVWAIVCNGRFFFSKVKLSQDLMPGMGWKDPPSSLLSLIMDKVMFAEQIMQPTFPMDWETVLESPINNRGDQRGGTP